MSAILSADDLNDFISPGVACIKPVETLPKQQPSDSSNPYEVTTEDKIAAANAPPASISLTDCLACSGCVTSAEAVLVSLQSHAEVLNTLDAYPDLPLPWTSEGEAAQGLHADGKIFVASVSPQSRASIATTYGVSEREAGHMIAQLLSGPLGLRSGGLQKSGFTWIVDTNRMRDAALVSAADEVQASLQDNPNTATTAIPGQDRPKKPILASACPGWICYAEKTHPHVLPHISRLKSPQALTGTLIKSVLARKYHVTPDKVWHLAVMPCFDKKLEASREELTDMHWGESHSDQATKGIRDVDCVITARELLMLAEARSISFPSLPRRPVSRKHTTPFPDAKINSFLFPPHRPRHPHPHSKGNGSPEAGTSGGYLHHILQTHLHALRTDPSHPRPQAELRTQRGRNADVVEYTIVDPSASDEVLFRSARYYGFRNIQNLVRRLKPQKVSRLPGAASRGGPRRPGTAKAASGASGPAGAGQTMNDYAYVEVMACPGGCTNGGGQIKVGDLGTLLQGGTGIENGGEVQEVLPQQKEWLAKVDEAYFSASSSSSPSSSDNDDDEDDERFGGVEENPNDKDEVIVDGISHTQIHSIISHWSQITGVEEEKLVCTTYRKVESDVGKKTTSDVERVAGLASSIGGGW